MLDTKRPWLAVYGGRLSDEPIGSSLTEFLEEVAEKYQDHVALTADRRKISAREGVVKLLATGFVRRRGFRRRTRCAGGRLKVYGEERP